MKIKKFLSLLLVVAFSLQLVSCANMSDQTRTRAEGAGLGALVGGLIGLAAGDTKGAIIGALAGAGVGFLIGNEIARRKAKYASEEDFLNAEIAQLARLNSSTYKYNCKLSRDIYALKKQVASLKARYKKRAVKRTALAKKKKEIQKRIEANNKMIEALEKEYKINVAILDEQKKKRKKKDPYVVKLEREIKTLKKNIDALQKNAKQLAEIDERLSV